MSKVYSVHKGVISEYKIAGETPYFYKVDGERYSRISKFGHRWEYLCTGTGIVTEDLTEAKMEAQAQIDSMNVFISKANKNVDKLQELLNKFHEV